MDARKVLALVGTLLAVTLTAGCGGSGSGNAPATTTGPTLLQKAEKACKPKIQKALKAGNMDGEATAEDFLSVGDSGKSLTLENAPQGGDLSAVLTVPAMMCLLKETKAPDAVRSQVEQTNALMGRQKASWSAAKVSWSYQPDSGVSAVFTVR